MNTNDTLLAALEAGNEHSLTINIGIEVGGETVFYEGNGVLINFNLKGDTLTSIVVTPLLKEK